MSIDQLLFCTFPCGIALVVDWPEVFLVCESSRIAIQTSQAGPFPSFDVHRQLPDRVRAGNRMCCSLFCSDSIQQRQHRWSMPPLTIKTTTKLVPNAVHFTDHTSFSRAIHRLHRFYESICVICGYSRLL